jgi:hypothetical protein
MKCICKHNKPDFKEELNSQLLTVIWQPSGEEVLKTHGQGVWHRSGVSKHGVPGFLNSQKTITKSRLTVSTSS